MQAHILIQIFLLNFLGKTFCWELFSAPRSPPAGHFIKTHCIFGPLSELRPRLPRPSNPFLPDINTIYVCGRKYMCGRHQHNICAMWHKVGTCPMFFGHFLGSSWTLWASSLSRVKMLKAQHLGTHQISVQEENLFCGFSVNRSSTAIFFDLLPFSFADIWALKLILLSQHFSFKASEVRFDEVQAWFWWKCGLSKLGTHAVNFTDPLILN